MKYRTLYRPVGLNEWKLICSSGRFPPRLYFQPIFYPVLNYEYAKKIAQKWNTNDEKSGYVGIVTKFEVEEDYLKQYEEKIVGNNQHCELWIPSESLEEFQNHIKDKIFKIDVFYGEKYVDDNIDCDLKQVE